VPERPQKFNVGTCNVRDHEMVESYDNIKTEMNGGIGYHGPADRQNTERDQQSNANCHVFYF